MPARCGRQLHIPPTVSHNCMRDLRYILILVLLFLISNFTFSSSIFYPYTLKLDNGIKIRSVAYRTYDTPDPGRSWIYKYNKLLYTIDKRLTGYLITDETGEILVEINYSLYDIMIDGHLVDEKGDSIFLDRFKGEAIRIYKKGILEKIFDFKELHIDKSLLETNYDQFYWGTKDESIKVPAVIQNDTLRLTSIDDSEIRISLQSLNLDKRALTNNKHTYFTSLKSKRKISVKKHGIPKNFLLPFLESKDLIESKLADYLGFISVENERDSARVQVYIHTLLIDREGKCVQCYVTPILRNSTSVDFGYEPDGELKKKIEDWLMIQKYQTKMIPRYTDKYGFSDFIYLKYK
jgi:hypothetical protein